ncbi:large subunit ribosomal protein L32e [Nematocida homosporus]|uniref:large subunit ribosomal protein L32e n=1 Tax=Nematocida homosporus TaxID=1912981 RepID=UPI00221FFE14|nr:large subunit ribosomal protein L32e [Nematocida homosporus]KAI5187394.1 large subunit ribosomal protein L32e [Nematocida homosporus]
MMNNEHLLITKPLVQFVKVKKTRREFNRFQSDQFKRVKPNWRRPRGIDNKVRKGLKGTMKMPCIGFKGNKLVRHILPNGFKKVIINNLKDLEALTSLNRVYCGEIARGVGAKKRVDIVKRAADLGIVLTNGHARIAVEKLD